MKEESLEVFIDGLTNYFDKTTESLASVSTPFLIQDVNQYLSDFTGIISISGTTKVRFSLPRRE